MIKKLSGCLIVLLLLTACGDQGWRTNGQWQMQTVEVDGTVMPADTVWYRFQVSLFNMKIYDPASGKYQECNGLINEQNDNQMTLLLQNADFIKLTDWSSTTRIFEVEKASGSKLILSSEGKRYVFRKF